MPFVIWLTNQRWFAIADFCFAAMSVILIETQPGLGGYALLAALIPWLLRLLAGRFPFQRTRFDIPVLIFILTALLGAWSAYASADGWNKFFLILSSVALYYAFAGQPKENRWLPIGLMATILIGTSFYFLITNDWVLYPGKIGLLDRAGLALMKIRPASLLKPMHPNNAAGLIAISVPFLIAIIIWLWNRKKKLLSVAGAILLAVSAIAFVWTTSRGASIGLVAGLIVWGLGARVSCLKRDPFSNPPVVFGVSGLVVVSLALGWYLFAHLGSAFVLNRLVFITDMGDRLGLAYSATKLIADYPWIGGGLNAFPGLYSYYIRVIPQYFLLDSHDLFLNIGLEQGLFGLIAFLWIYLGCIYLTWKKTLEFPLFAGAVLAGLVAACIHGGVDNIINDAGSAPLVFFLPGISLALIQPDLVRPDSRRLWKNKSLRWLAAALVAVLLMVVMAFWRPLTASWYANLGAVEMSRVELVTFPDNKWDEGQKVTALKSAEADFLTALQYSPTNVTANYRLGLIAMMGKDYSKAICFLEKAHTADPYHRGVIKTLGYCYTWAGELDKAQIILKNIQEAPQEMDVYTWWWQTQGRNDLSLYAHQMAVRLK